MHSTIPNSNRECWENKIVTNQALDADTGVRFETNGWSVLRLWEFLSINKAESMVLARLRWLQAGPCKREHER